MGQGPDQFHEYVSFEDPDEDRTWFFDVTFLSSPWTCIYGQGCRGVLTESSPELEEGCCSYGAHLTGEDDVRRVLRHARQLRDDEWQFKKEAIRRGGPIKRKNDEDAATRMVDEACIFLNRPGFSGGAGCALHQGAVHRGERPLDWKPDVCWQLPLRRVDEVDSNGHVNSTIREWKRRDWGEGGFEFHWWCTEASDAFVGHQPVYETLRDELVEMVGEKPYRQLVQYLHGRGQETLVAHPAMRNGHKARRSNGATDGKTASRARARRP